MGTVRFQSDFDGNVGHKKRYSSISRLTKGTQSDEIVYNATGTDPLKAPERGTQTDKEYLLWNRSAANSLRISSNLVNLLLNELDNISAELPLLKVYERFVWGNDFEREQKRKISLQLLRETELPKTEGFSSTCQPFVVRCGLGSRVAVLFAEPEQDSHCSEHVGHLLLNLRRKQNNWIQLPACPSDAIFGRHGELHGYSNNFQDLFFKEGKIFSKEMQTFKVSKTSEYIGPFLIGTIESTDGDVGAGVWSPRGLIGINLGATTYHDKNGKKLMNYMVAMEDVMTEINKLKIKDKITEEPKFVIRMKGVGKESYKSI